MREVTHGTYQFTRTDMNIMTRHGMAASLYAVFDEKGNVVKIVLEILV